MFQAPTQAALPTRNRLRRPGHSPAITSVWLPLSHPLSHHRSVAVSALVFKMDVIPQCVASIPLACVSVHFIPARVVVRSHRRTGSRGRP